MQKIALLLLGLTSSFYSLAQLTPVGEWNNYLPFRNIVGIAESQDRIYASSETGVFYYDKEDGSVQRLSAVQGLYDVNITAIGGSPDKSTILLGYEDGAIDIIIGNKVITKLDITRGSVIGEKTINHFNFVDSICYVSTGFGIMEFNYREEEFNETYYIGPNGSNVKVNQTHVFQDTLYAATDRGLFKASLSSFLSRPDSWSLETSLLLTPRDYSHVSSLGNELLVNLKSEAFRSDTLFARKNGAWSINTTRLGEANNSIEKYNDWIVVAASSSVEVYDSTWNVVRREFTYNDNQSMVPNFAFMGEDEVIWIGDLYLGLAQNLAPFITTMINLSGPVSNKSFAVVYEAGNMHVAGGGYTTNWFTFKAGAELSILENNNWSVWSKANDSTFARNSDLSSVTANPQNANEIYAATLNGGIFHMVNGSVVDVLDHTNSPLEAINNSLLFISDIRYDQFGSLWIANSEVDHPLKVYANDNQWYLFNIQRNGSKLTTGRITITSQGHIWMSLQDEGLLVYDPGPRFGDTSDDRLKYFSSAAGSGNLPDNEVYAMTEDEDGHMWIGTRAGVRVFYNASNVFSDNFPDARDIFVNQDGQTKILLEDVLISDIRIDGANQKWFATLGSGTILMSADGTQEIAHFTHENSPLFSDQVQSLGIDGKTGEVFFGTDKGLVSYRGTATDGKRDFSQLQVFPNPVTPEYDGLIGISGLMANSSIRITDAAGNLVFVGESRGGQATWDGNNLNGNKCTSGVYLIFAIDEDGEENGVTKVLLTN